MLIEFNVCFFFRYLWSYSRTVLLDQRMNFIFTLHVFLTKHSLKYVQIMTCDSCPQWEIKAPKGDFYQFVYLCIAEYPQK